MTLCRTGKKPLPRLMLTTIYEAWHHMAPMATNEFFGIRQVTPNSKCMVFFVFCVRCWNSLGEWYVNYSCNVNACSCLFSLTMGPLKVSRKFSYFLQPIVGLLMPYGAIYLRLLCLIGIGSLLDGNKTLRNTFHSYSRKYMLEKVGKMAVI